MSVLLERGKYRVVDDGGSYGVYRASWENDSSYAHSTDGLSIALARCEYLAKRDALKNKGK